jgi:hypothetical protein
VAESSGLVLRRSRPGSIWSALPTAFAQHDLSGDHAPGDRLPAWQLAEPGVADDHPELAESLLLRFRVGLLLAISMPQDGSMMPISFVPLKEIVKAPGTSDL